MAVMFKRDLSKLGASVADARCVADYVSWPEGRPVLDMIMCCRRHQSLTMQCRCSSALCVAQLVGGVVVWLAGHAHLSCLNLRQWITIGVDIRSCVAHACCCAAAAVSR
jgi:hypothetical protein